MIKTIDLGWAAGFLEGEGWFGAAGNSAKIGAAQNEIQPLEKLQNLFGGKISIRKNGGFSSKAIYWWALDAVHSAAAMMTLYSLMSPRRQEQIKSALDKWKSARRLRPRGFDICIRGHELVGDNLQVFAGGRTRCRECHNKAKRDRRAMTRRSIIAA